MSARRPLPALSSLVAASVAAALLAGCGTTETSSAAGEGEGTQGGAAAGPVTVTDARGQEVELDAPAERVVALEWAEVEMLRTLGADVVGAADPKGYATWNDAEPLADATEDVGFRAEPSVDAIVALEPDLVVLEADGGDAAIRQLEEYVPVLVTEGSDASRNLERMREDFRMVAEAVGATDEADQVLEDLDGSFEEARSQIADAGHDGAPFAMADGWMEGSNVAIRMFAEGSLFSDVAEEVGLENAWPREGDQMWGLATTDVEGLTPLKDEEDLTFLYSASDEPDVFAEGLADNAIWQSMPFVRADRLHKLDEGTWTFGGPASVEGFLEQLVEIFGS